MEIDEVPAVVWLAAKFHFLKSDLDKAENILTAWMEHILRESGDEINDVIVGEGGETTMAKAMRCYSRAKFRF